MAVFISDSGAEMRRFLFSRKEAVLNNRESFVTTPAGNVRLGEWERQALILSANQDGLKVSEKIRELIRNDAKAKGLWPPVEKLGRG